MFTSRLSQLVVVIVLVALVSVTVSFTNLPKNSETYQDYAQRHWGEFGASHAPDSTDYFLRHPELHMSRTADATDYFFRQSNS